MIQCNDCGRFMKCANGASSAAMYDMVAMECSHEHMRCAACTEKFGPVQSNARPANGDMRPFQSTYT